MKKFIYLLGLIFLLPFAQSCGRSESTADLDKDAKELVSDDENKTSSNREYSTKMPKPSKGMIKSDLEGMSIGEGLSQGYHKKDWTYTITQGEISNFHINEVLVDEPDLYIVICGMRIKPNASFYYDTVLKIIYVKDKKQGWILDNVVSKGMRVVSNGAYDDCISTDIEDDGWGGTYCLKLSNNSSSSLIVGGRVLLTNDSWKTFSVRIDGNDKASVGGAFSGSVKDYKIDFVVKEY